MAVLCMRNKKYAIWPLLVAESPKFLHLNKEIGVGEHEGYVSFLTGSRNIGVSRIGNEKYAIWPLVMAESQKLLHSSAMDL